jgi:hypothetical protein
LGKALDVPYEGDERGRGHETDPRYRRQPLYHRGLLRELQLPFRLSNLLAQRLDLVAGFRHGCPQRVRELEVEGRDAALTRRGY